MTITSEKIAELRGLLEKATSGEWMVQDSCSFRRIGTRFGGDGNVISPTIQRSDGHPDLLAKRHDLDLIVALRNAAPDLLDEIEGKQRIIDAQAGLIADLQREKRESEAALFDAWQLIDNDLVGPWGLAHAGVLKRISLEALNTPGDGDKTMGDA